LKTITFKRCIFMENIKCRLDTKSRKWCTWLRWIGVESYTTVGKTNLIIFYKIIIQYHDIFTLKILLINFLNIVYYIVTWSKTYEEPCIGFLNVFDINHINFMNSQLLNSWPIFTILIYFVNILTLNAYKQKLLTIFHHFYYDKYKKH